MGQQGSNRQAPPNFRGPRHHFGPKRKAKNQKETILRIWNQLSKHRLKLWIVLVFVFVSTVLGLLGPYYLGVTIDSYILKKDVPGSIQMAVLLAAIYLAGSLFTWLQQDIMVRVSLTTIRTIREELFAKLQQLSLRFFDTRSQGDLMSRVTNDIDNLNNALSQSLVQIFSSVLTIAGVTIAMLSLNWMMAMVSFLIIPVMLFVSRKIIAVSSQNFAKRQADLGQLNGYIEEAISGKEVITLYGQEKKTIQEFHEINEELRKSAMLAETFSGFLGPVNNFINNLGFGLIIATGAILTLNDMASIGVIAAFVTYSKLFFRPINQLTNLWNTIQSAIAGAERVFEVMDEVPDLQDSPNAAPVVSFEGDIEFRNVSFGYEKDHQILKNISLKASPGETIALVGPTGSGKTTIINLLSRFYDRSSGELFIDDKPIEAYKMADLRKRIGIVLQETYLFSGTLMENIRYGRLDATDEEVIEAAKIAAAHQFIKHLPERYETKITSGGTNLSQGQRQLLAIARAILADSDILILDEATSSIDTRTEIAIQEGLKNLTKGKTTFVIAHRLKTIEKADRIYVIDHGQIRESGTHDELLASEGFYYQLYTQQFKQTV
ncbi:multidrug ABC transporter ATP-binding protein [Pradoshia eiseniae]|uniref:Multidrug ABC transporter ATP-binding protein n=1 Tax=Pradoshia eiseniae TaxID=2064768 RepID=A0A2S7N106_9BACI|nr:ABC transporter ATP-binding protein [Pradoshia eiseniae]PQD95706.1 multidrug ABC transporter ATP-binding protein [Pradoshia eiseniae]